MSDKLTVFEGWSLDASDAEEPRVRDTELAERAGLAEPRKIRRAIEKNRAELEQHGGLHMRAQQARISKPNGGTELRTVNEYWLNEAQATTVLLLMRTPQAVAVRVGVVKVFTAWRRGQLSAPPPALPLDVAHGPRVGEHPVLRKEMARQCQLAARASGYSLQAIHGAIRRLYLVGGIYKTPALAMPHVKLTLEAIALGELELPSRARRDAKAELARRQMPFPFQ